MTPSSTKLQDRATSHSPSGIKFGTAVHALLEQVAWVDESLKLRADYPSSLLLRTRLLTKLGRPVPTNSPPASTKP